MFLYAGPKLCTRLVQGTIEIPDTSLLQTGARDPFGQREES